jgi:hypothetical protein
MTCAIGRAGGGGGGGGNGVKKIFYFKCLILLNLFFKS